ncbi:disulfide bond formation protein B [Acidimangrovimonas pyrenivorans]|uniref:Disulfide bond formation protein B n=1 Tax=Acidimangrovimonas pyrenivorans TaxID=2030798 RepID=A0ABV7AF35_9RHOB
MTKPLVLLAGTGSAALLLGALGFQYIGGYRPCELCLLQRWPHGIAIALALVALYLPFRLVPALGALTMAVSTGFGLYHTGVEQKWWQGPSECTSSTDITHQSAQQLLDQIMSAPITRCDEVQWTFLHLSMASWNAILSLLLALVWVAAARRKA